MTGYLIYPSTTPRANNAFDWWKQAAARYGIDLQVMFYDGYGQSEAIDCDGTLIAPQELARPDFVILRGYNTALSRWWESCGVRVINPTDAMLLCRDKLSTAQALSKAGIATPRTYSEEEVFSGRQSDSPAERYAAICRLLGADRFILKQNFGSKGENVFLITSEEEYAAAVRICEEEKLRRLDALTSGENGLSSEFGQTREEVLRGCSILLQEYIQSSFGRDIRVWVCGGQVIGHILRYNDHSFKSNFAAGGSFRNVELPQGGARLAVAAAAAVGLDFAGIDLLYTSEDTFTVCEVNGNAGFRTASADIPDGIFRTLFK